MDSVTITEFYSARGDWMNSMNKMVIYALVVGIVMYVLVIYLAFIQKDLTIHQLILMLAAPFVSGFLSGGIKKGLILGFIIPLVMLMVEAIVIQPGAFTDANVVMAIILMMVLPFAGISAALGVAGGFLGKRIFKK